MLFFEIKQSRARFSSFFLDHVLKKGESRHCFLPLMYDFNTLSEFADDVAGVAGYHELLVSGHDDHFDF